MPEPVEVDLILRALDLELVRAAVERLANNDPYMLTTGVGLREKETGRTVAILVSDDLEDCEVQAAELKPHVPMEYEVVVTRMSVECESTTP